MPKTWKEPKSSQNEEEQLKSCRFEIPRVVHAALKVQAACEGTTMRELVIEGIRHVLARSGRR